jgi:hypothetical protein
MSYREQILKSFGGKISMTMANVKTIVWKIDELRFGGEIKKAKGKKYAVGYHRDAYIQGRDDTLLPYSVKVDHGYIHIGAPGSKEQIKFYQNQFGLTNDTDTIFAIAEDILLDMAYGIFGFQAEKESLLGCVRKVLFSRSMEAPPELVLDVWGVIMENMNHKDIAIISKINSDLHRMACKRLQGIKPFHELKYQIVNGTDCHMDQFMSYYKKYPLEVDGWFVMNEIVKRRKCPEIIKFLKDQGLDLERTLYTSFFKPYDSSDSRYFESNGIYTPEELKIINERFVRGYAKLRGFTIADARKLTGFSI